MSKEQLLRIAPEGCLAPHGLPLNPFKVRVRKEGDAWVASYKKRNGKATVVIRGTRTRALAELRHFVRLKVVEIDGQFREVL